MNRVGSWSAVGCMYIPCITLTSVAAVLAAGKQRAGVQCQLEVSVKLWWLHDNEREHGHDTGQVTSDGVIVAVASLGVLVGCDWGLVESAKDQGLCDVK